MAPTLTTPRTDRRTEILESTCRVIVRDGVDGIRSQRVAREAGVSPALPHYYYPTLEDLVRAAFALVEEREDARVAALRPTGDAVADLEALLVLPLEGSVAAVRERWVLRTEFQRRALFDPSVGALERARVAAEAQRLCELVAAAQAAGAVPARVDPVAMAVRLQALQGGLGAMTLIGLVDPVGARRQLARALAARGAWMATADVAAHRPRRGPDEAPAAEPGDTRAAILDATVDLIAEAGVAGVHFPEVAARAGVSASLPRYYFPTIAGLVAAAFDRNTERTRQRVERRVAAVSDPLDRLRDAYAYEVALDPALVRPNWVLWSELVRMGTLDPDRRGQVAERLRGWMAYDAELIGELQEAGRVARDLDVAGATERLVATLNGAGMLWMLGAIAPEAFADLLNHAIDDELGLGASPGRG